MNAATVTAQPSTAFHMWTHGCQELPAPGCSVHALETAEVAAGPASGACAHWGTGLRSRVLSGSYQEIAERWSREVREVRAAVLIFSQGDGMENFLSRIGPQSKGLPIVGGAAARAADARGEIAPGADGDVLAWLIESGEWIAETLNVHQPQQVRCEFKADGPRLILELKLEGGEWETADAVFQKLQAQFGVKSGDFETITFSDTLERNLHCRRSGKALACGSDLPLTDPVLVVRKTDPAQVQQGLERFVSAPGSLVFACAGLFGLLGKRLQPAPGTLAGFMFGEVVSSGTPGGVAFGNLMASRLRRISV